MISSTEEAGSSDMPATQSPCTRSTVSLGPEPLADGGARGGGGVSCAFVGKPRREEGIRIHTVFDQPPAAASEATPAAKEVQETMDDVLVGVEKLEVLD